MKVLVVDGDQAFRETVANLLLICGVDKFEMATSTREALEMTSQSFFDFILIDFLTPPEGGVYFAEEFQKREPKTKTILLVEEQVRAELNSTGEVKLSFPTILKPFVSRDLPQLLSGETDELVDDDD